MDPVTLIITALVSGVAAGLKPTAEKIITEGYEGLKGLLQRKFSQVDVKSLEQKPESKSKQDSLAEDLTDAGADKDAEVLHAAQELVKLIESKAPEAAAAVGIDLKRLRAGASIKIEDIVASGTGIRGEDWEATHDITIKGVRAGHPTEDPAPNA